MPSCAWLKTKSLKSLWDKDKFEVTLRVGIICICGFALSIASIPNLVPPSQALMPGLMAAVLSQVLPTLMFSVTIVPAIVLVVLIGVCAFSTMLLAAASVSSGLFIGIYVVFTLLMTTLYFGKMYSFTSGLANLYIAMSGLFGLSYLPLVEQGGLNAVADMWKEQGMSCFVSTTRMCVSTCLLTHMMIFPYCFY